MLLFYGRYIDRLSTDFFFTFRLLQLLLIFFVVVYSTLFFSTRGSKTREGWQVISIAESIYGAYKCIDGDEMLVLGAIEVIGNRQLVHSIAIK